MKASLTITALILAVAGVIGWQNKVKLEDAHAVRDRLKEEAKSLGLDADELLKNGASPRRMKSQRESTEDKQAHAKDFAKRLADFANEMNAFEKQGQEPGPEMQKRIFAIIDEMLKLDAGQLKVVVAELKVAPGIDEEMRRGIIGFAIMTLSDRQPSAALTLYVESADLLKGPGSPGDHLVTSALAKWAEDDPVAAMEWYRSNTKEHPDVVSSSARLGLVTGAARQDPRLAFKLISELGLSSDMQVGQNLARQTKTTAEKTALLAAFREQMKGTSDADTSNALRKSIMEGMATKMTEEGYEASASWLGTASLSQEEAQAMAKGLSSWQMKGDDTGKWIDWMSDKLPADAFKEKVNDMMRNWTTRDYKAAGEWINATKDGPVRQAAAQTYAVTVAPYEPESAAQWAETLPAGTDRDQAFKSIHAEWKKKDEAAAAEFARKNGIAP
ncbi:hypothetical protein [Luteolibacter luteus]|uniref:Uncharacterized protein n=1 Tax=Luteolibacter luteus TaxID=2728835 RepID=A0A858RIU0_9BACT|nr:hypothetical protein [Luteolibacter luteus]QJE96339.1 hypothetical protein HHL09_11260 [Luteolibacter luteus]